MKRCICTFSIFILSFIFAFPQTSFAQTGLENIYEPREYYSDAGDTLRYRIMFPEVMTADSVYPLVLFLHGAGERGNDNTAQLAWGLDVFADEDFRKDHPAIVIAPQVPAGSFWANLNWRQQGAALMDEPALPLKLAYELVLEMKESILLTNTGSMLPDSRWADSAHGTSSLGIRICSQLPCLFAVAVTRQKLTG